MGCGVRRKPLPYSYAAIEPVRHDARGRVTAIRSWVVRCGPPPPPPADPQASAALVTDRPLPGLTVVDDHCQADDAATVRAAARASEAWERPTTSRWERRARWWRGER
jgi:hypothetical protein